MKKITFKIPDDIHNYFNSKVWKKAYEIYRNHQIISIYAKNEKEIVAKVQGTALYTVLIKLENNKIIMDCNCPYWDNCKHEAAVLIYVKNHPEIEARNERISMTLPALDEFRLFLSSVLYELDSDEEYRHDNDTYNDGVNDCVDYIENTLASRKEKIQMLFLLMDNFCINRSVCSCFMNLYKEDNELCENLLCSYLMKKESSFYELSKIGDYLKSEIEKENYCTLIDNVIHKLDSNQISIMKSYLIRHEKAWNIVKKLFDKN